MFFARTVTQSSITKSFMAVLAEWSRHASVARATGVRTSYTAPKNTRHPNAYRRVASDGSSEPSLGNGSARSGRLPCKQNTAGFESPVLHQVLRDRSCRE